MPDTDPTKKFHGLDPGELLARSLDTVKPTGGASAWEPPTPEELAKLLPQYRIESLLGRGGMGAVYKGVQAALERPVAIKLLPAELAGDGDFLVRFQREARTLAKLQHPGIVTVHDFGQTSEGHLYFVMEFVDGTDLQHILKGPGLQPAQAFEMIAQICDALFYAHGQGVIHRDIKPANILVTKAGRAKVADFGLARPITEDTGGLTATNVIMGTPDYMAPEQRSGVGHADHRADIFALGVMLYEMLTGQRPTGAFQPPSHRVQVDVRIDEVVLKALQQEPDRRYQQASEMKVDVDRIRTTPPEKVKPVGGRRSVAALIAAAVAILGIVLWFAFGKKEPQLSEAARVAKAQSSPALQRVEPSATTGRPDGLKPPTTLPAATATKDVPFVNTLGTAPADPVAAVQKTTAAPDAATSSSAAKPPSPTVPTPGITATEQIIGWAFKYGGSVTILPHGGKEVKVTDATKLPSGPFDILVIQASGEYIADAEFALLSQAPRLRRILLGGRNHLTSLKPLAGLTELTELHLGGIGEIGSLDLPEQEMAHLAGLARLQSLSLLLAESTGEGCEYLRELKSLRYLDLGTVRLSAKGAEAIGSLTQLTDLILRIRGDASEKTSAPSESWPT